MAVLCGRHVRRGAGVLLSCLGAVALALTPAQASADRPQDDPAPVDTAPQAQDVSATVQGNTSRQGDVAQLDLTAFDPDDTDLDYELLQQPTDAQGEAAVSGAQLTFVPAKGFAGAVTLPYRVTDPSGESDTATATITVLPNNPPVGTVTSASTVNGRPIVITLAATDAQGDIVSFSPVLPPNSREASVSYGGTRLSKVTFTPVAGFVGNSTFTYRMQDDRGAVANQQVTVTVAANRPPVVAAATAQTRGSTAGGGPGVPVELALSASDPEGDTPVTFALQHQPDNGTAELTAAGLLRYTPNAGFVGVDRVDVRVTDRVVVNGVQKPELQSTDTASAKITVTANQAPDAPTVSVRARGSTAGPGEAVRVTLHATDPDGDAITYSVFDPAPSVGQVVMETSSFVFVPAQNFSGPAIVEYRVTDALGATTSGVAVVDVAKNGPPTAARATAITRGGTTTAGLRVDIPLTAAIADPDDDPVTVVSAVAANGSATVSGPQKVSYVPRAGFSGTDTVSYTVADGRGGSATSTVGVSVSANRAPAMTEQSRRIPAGSRVAVTLGATDPDGDPVTFATGAATRGTLSLTGSRLLYTSRPDFAGTVVVSTRATDVLGAVGTSRVSYAMYGSTTISDVVVSGATASSRPRFAMTVRANVGSTSGGLLTVTRGTTVLGSARVAWNGSVSVASRVVLPRGVHVLGLSYGGTATAGTTSGTIRVTVSG